MKRFVTTCAFLLLCTGCNEPDELAPKDMDLYTMDYSVSRNQYVVVVAEDDGITKSEAMEYAIERAAKITHEHGFRYFYIENESDVIVLRTTPQPAEETMPKNIYYEQQQSSNFGRDKLLTPEMEPSHSVQGFRLEFACQENKPYGKYYDVCELGYCD